MNDELDKLAESFEESGPLTIMVFGQAHRDERYLAEHGVDFYGVLWGLMEGFLRRKISNGGHDYKTPAEALQAVWDEAYRLMDENGVSLDAVS